MLNTALVRQKIIQIRALDEFHWRRGQCFIITVNDAEDELFTHQRVRAQAYNGNKHSWLLFQLGPLHECTVPHHADQ